MFSSFNSTELKLVVGLLIVFVFFFSTELVQEMLLLSLDMIRDYGQAYEHEVHEFKSKYFEDRSKVCRKTIVSKSIVISH